MTHRSGPRRILAAAALLAAFGLRAEEPPRLALPLECVPGESCWVVNYVDEDPGPRAADYTCGSQSYDKHTGTDFGIRNLAEMRRGVAVLASAPGVVRATRNDAADGQFRREEPGAVAGRECGNGVLIDHEGGWQTQYCHMRSGSVAVNKGDRVGRGARLGLVGLSGRTEFPHVHLTVRHRGRTLDPFTGQAAPAACGAAGGASLWSEAARAALKYRPVSIYDAGVAGAMPGAAQIHDGEGIAPAKSGSPALVAWAAFYGVREGDEIAIALSGPDGRRFIDRRKRADRTQARRYELAGLKRTAESWRPGRYQLTVRVTRAQPQGAPLVIERELSVEIE